MSLKPAWLFQLHTQIMCWLADTRDAQIQQRERTQTLLWDALIMRRLREILKAAAELK